MRSSLALCLLLAAVFSRAEDPPQPAAPTPAADQATQREPEPDYNPAADADHDGHVTRRENRRYRRAQRRAARRAQGLPDEEEPEDDPAEEERQEQRRQRALRRATQFAQEMKQDVREDPGAGDAGSGSGAARSSSRSSSSGGAASALAQSGGGTAAAPRNFTATTAGAKSPGAGAALGAIGSQGSGAPAWTPGAPSGDPSRPSAPEDFVLAARGGYAPALARAGLKLSADGRAIVRKDGAPATAEDYGRLDREIRAMPAALAQRPDFFRHVSPARYADLKTGYVERPQFSNTVFKHVETTEADRDFVHSKSCTKLSGECNESAVRESYKKGEFVDPKDLDKMWSALEQELATDDPGGVADRARPEEGQVASLDSASPGRSEAPPPSDSAAPATSERHSASVPGEAESKEATPVLSGAVRSAGRAWNDVVVSFGGKPISNEESGEQGAAVIAVLIGAAGAVGTMLFMRLRRSGDDGEDPSEP